MKKIRKIAAMALTVVMLAALTSGCGFWEITKEDLLKYG